MGPQALKVRSLLKVDIVRILDFGHNESAVRAANAFHWAQFIEDEILVMFHVTGKHFQKEIVISWYIVAFYYLVDLKDIRNKPMSNFPVMLFELDITKYNKSLVELFRVK